MYLMSHLLIVHKSLLYLFLFFWHNPVVVVVVVGMVRRHMDVQGLERFITLFLLESSKIRHHLLQRFINHKMERRKTQPSHQTSDG